MGTEIHFQPELFEATIKTSDGRVVTLRNIQVITINGLSSSGEIVSQCEKRDRIIHTGKRSLYIERNEGILNID